MWAALRRQHRLNGAFIGFARSIKTIQIGRQEYLFSQYCNKMLLAVAQDPSLASNLARRI
jgi:hypothetical protein